MYDNNTVREFYSTLWAVIKGAKIIGRVHLLINDQTVPRIMGKMAFADWKEWAMRRPERAQENLGTTFKRFVERRWRDALNVVAAEPSGREDSGSRPEKAQVDKAHPEKTPAEKATGTSKRSAKVTGVANIVTSSKGYRERRCQFHR